MPQQLFNRSSIINTRSLILLTALATVTPAAFAQQTTSPPTTPPTTQPTTAPATTTTEDELQQRLDFIIDELEQQRQNLHIPGMALAIVKDGEVILQHGFGLRDIENDLPVTPETLFQIGSTTKAFTATLIAMLVEEGKMNWDDPAADHIPGFALQVESENEDDVITIRDLMSHRSGFSRMGVLWAGGTATREEIIKAAANAKPFDTFRKSFNYNNIMVMAGGMAAGNAAGTSWENLVTLRLFDPLGMTNSSTTAAAVEGNPQFSRGYDWIAENNDWKRRPMRNIDVVGPAGSINSNVIDMANWVKLQLGRGEVTIDGNTKRLISQEQLEETWQPQITMGGNTSYALGWMVHDEDGRRVVEHGGNIDGFAAAVAMLPDENIGFVLLTNVSATPLQSSARNIIWDALLEELPSDDAAPQEDYEPYLGRYLLNFGQLRDAELTVLVQNDLLAVDVPGQMVYELKAPDEDGKRYFQLTDQVAVSFKKDDDGNVLAMRMHQAGQTAVAPRIGITIPSNVDPQFAEKVVGKYQFEGENERATVSWNDPQLQVNATGQPTLTLLHDADNIERPMSFKALEFPMLSMWFDEDDDGNIIALSVQMNDGDIDVGNRMLEDANDEASSDDNAKSDALPTVEELKALMQYDEQIAAREQITTMKISSKMSVVNAGVVGRNTVWVDGLNRYVAEVDLSPFVQQRVIVDDGRGWQLDTTNPEPIQEMEGQLLEQLQHDHPLSSWSAYPDMTVLRRDELDGSPVIIARLSGTSLPPATIYVDVNTGHIKRIDSSMIIPGIGAMPLITTMSEYHIENGVLFPFHVEIETPQSGIMINEIESITFDVEVPEHLFDPNTFDVGN